MPGNQQRDLKIGEDRVLKRFQKFSPPKFLGELDLEIAENCFERMVDIFAALHYIEERQVTDLLARLVDR